MYNALPLLLVKNTSLNKHESVPRDLQALQVNSIVSILQIKKPGRREAAVVVL